MTKLYRYRNQELTVKELVALSNNIGYDTMTNRLRKGWSVDDAVKTPLHSRPNKAKIDLLKSIPEAQTFDGVELNKHDKIMIASLIDEYLQQKQRGMALLEKQKDPKQMPRV